MFVVLGIISLLHPSLCVNPSGILFREVYAYHNETFYKAQFAYEVVQKIYNAFRQWFFTIIFCEFTYFENRILKYTETYDYGYPVMLLDGCPSKNQSRVKPRINKHGESAYIVTSNELSLDVNDAVISALKRTGVFKRRSTVIFVINVPIQIDSYFYYAMKSHFQLLWSKRISNSVLITWSDELRMYSYNPFFDKVSDITDVTDVSRLLFHQYDNLYGKELRLSVFRKFYISNNTGSMHCNSKLASTVMKHLNATCKPLAPRDKNTVGDMLENGTATGVTADLIDGYTDLELESRILKTSYYGYIDTTYPLAQDELCFMVKKSGKQSTFTTTLNLISTNILIIMMCNVVFLLFVAIVVRKIEKVVWNINETQTATATVLDLVKCLIRQTVDIKFLGPVFRFVVLMIIMYSLVIDCAIDGIIISAITYPRYKPDLDKLSRLVKTNMTLGVHNRDMDIFNKSFGTDYPEVLEKRVEVFFDRKIRQVITKKHFHYAILLRLSEAKCISRQPENMARGRPVYHIMKECPLQCKIVYGLRYGSPFLPRINIILSQLNQGGILQYWDESDENAFRKTESKVIVTDTKQRKPLNLGNLQEVFFVWAIGLLISTFIFFLEILLNTFGSMLLAEK